MAKTPIDQRLAVTARIVELRRQLTAAGWSHMGTLSYDVGDDWNYCTDCGYRYAKGHAGVWLNPGSIELVESALATH